jgi:predicted RNA-binding protein with PIN domain
MSLHYIIDGYNLIKHRSFNPPAGIHDSRFALIQFLRINKPCGSPKHKVTVVFDGYSNDLSLSGLEFEVIFSCEDSADERIKKIVEKERLPKSLIVVSDDRQIRDFARLCGVISLGIEDFLNPPSKKSASRKIDQEKTQLSYSAAHKINEELKRLWLKN